MGVQDNGIIFEVVPLGNSVKATAIDTATGIEGAIVAPRNTPLPILKSNALKKLKYVMEKKKQDEG